MSERGIVVDDDSRQPRRISVTVTVPRGVYDELLAYCITNNVLRSVAISRLIEHGLKCDAMQSLNDW
jgi:hypothetical protein